MSEGQMCAICNKRIASVFITKMDEKGNAVNQGICLVCAKKMRLPQVDQFLSKMGISDEDLESINDEMTSVMQSFENGDVSDFLSGEHDSETDEDLHVHFFCERCRRTYCLENIAIPEVALPEGFEQCSVNFMVKGICPQCKGKK